MARSSGGKKNQDNTAKTTSQTTSLDQLTDQVLEATTDIKPAEVNLSVKEKKLKKLTLPDNPFLKGYNFFKVKTEKVAEEYLEEQERKEATEDLIVKYCQTLDDYRAISTAFNNTYGKYLLEKFKEKFWELRRDFKDTYKTSGTNANFDEFAEKSGIIFKVRGKEVVILKEFQDQYDKNTGKIKTVKLHNHDNPKKFFKELDNSGRIIKIQDPISNFNISYCPDQFNVECNELNGASYIAIEPNENYYDMELDDNGNPLRLIKSYGITTADFRHGIDIKTLSGYNLHIDKLMKAFNNFFVKELESIGVDLSKEDKETNYYELYEKSPFSVYVAYVSKFNITIGSMIPYPSKNNPLSREVLISNKDLMFDGKMAMLSELKKPKIIEIILRDPKKIKIPPKLRKLFTEIKEDIQSEFVENPEEVLSAYSQYKLSKESLIRNSSKKNISSQEQENQQENQQQSLKSLDNTRNWVRQFEQENNEIIEFLQQIDSKLFDELIEFGTELNKAWQDKYRLENKEKLENQTSYDEGKRGGATIDPEPDLEEEAILSDYSEVMRNLDKEYPSELEHLREIPNKNLGRNNTSKRGNEGRRSQVDKQEDEDDIDQ